MNKKGTKKRELLRKIKDEFPELSFFKSKLIDYGDDHAVVVLDNKIVFRFPRTVLYSKSFTHELKLLDTLKYKSYLPVPDYTYIARQKTFGGYKQIRGAELTQNRFNHLTKETKKQFIADVARFLNSLHSLSKTTLPAYRAAEPWSMTNLTHYRTRYWKERRKVIAPFIDNELLELIDHFYEQFKKACATCKHPTIIHGDLSADHMLFNRRLKSLSGIIDFADAAIGDPAHDFSYFWCYGDEIVRAVYKRYDFHTDQKLLYRSKWYYARYLIDQLYFLIKSKKLHKAARIRNSMHRLLPTLLD